MSVVVGSSAALRRLDSLRLTGVKKMHFSDLSAQTELLERLETEPLVDYLRKHGVFSATTAERILASETPLERNRLLLQAIDTRPQNGGNSTTPPTDGDGGGSTAAVVPQEKLPTFHSLSSCTDTNTATTTCPTEDWEKHPPQRGLNSVGLFVNALRHTGYHRLASLLDNERRIQPIGGRRGSKGSLKGLQTRSRHRGQIAVIIQVSAVKVSATRYGLAKPEEGAPGGQDVPDNPTDEWHAGGAPTEESNRDGTLVNCWIAVEDVGSALSTAAKSKALSDTNVFGSNGSTTTAPPPVAMVPEKDKKAGKKQGHSGGLLYLCCCCCLGKRKSKSRPPPPQVLYSPVPEEAVDGRGDWGSSVLAKSKSENAIIRFREEPDGCVDTHAGARPGPPQQQEMKAGILNTKSELLYTILHDPTTLQHERLVKFFEQEVGVLVLDCFYDEAFLVALICTEVGKLEALKSAQLDGSLARDLERLLLTKDVLHSLAVKGIKLGVTVDEEEYNQALSELSSN